MHQPIGLGAADECSFRPPGHIDRSPLVCDGAAGKAPDFGLKSHVKARGLQATRRRCCVGRPISADFGCFSTPVSTAGGHRGPVALPIYHLDTAMTSDPLYAPSAPDTSIVDLAFDRASIKRVGGRARKVAFVLKLLSLLGAVPACRKGTA